MLKYGYNSFSNYNSEYLSKDIFIKPGSTSFPGSQHSYIVEMNKWQYWWWFWFTLFFLLYYAFINRLLMNRGIYMLPKIVTSYRSHGRWGDLIICAIPVFWCTNILSHSHYMLRAIEWQSESSIFYLRVRGKQWYWVYKWDLNNYASIDKIPRIIGRGKKVQFADYTYEGYDYKIKRSESGLFKKNRQDSTLEKSNMILNKNKGVNIKKNNTRVAKPLTTYIRVFSHKNKINFSKKFTVTNIRLGAKPKSTDKVLVNTTGYRRSLLTEKEIENHEFIICRYPRKSTVPYMLMVKLVNDYPLISKNFGKLHSIIRSKLFNKFLFKKYIKLNRKGFARLKPTVILVTSFGKVQDKFVSDIQIPDNFFDEGCGCGPANPFVGDHIRSNGIHHNFFLPNEKFRLGLMKYLLWKKNYTRSQIKSNNLYMHNVIKLYGTIMSNIKVYYRQSFTTKTLMNLVVRGAKEDLLMEFMEKSKTYTLRGIPKLISNAVRALNRMHVENSCILFEHIWCRYKVDKNPLVTFYKHHLLFNLARNIWLDAPVVHILTGYWDRVFNELLYTEKRGLIHVLYKIIGSNYPGSYVGWLKCIYSSVINGVLDTTKTSDNYSNYDYFFEKNRNIVSSIAKHYVKVRWIRNNYLNKNVYDTIKNSDSLGFRKFDPNLSSIRVENANNHIIIKQKRVNPVIFDGKLMAKKYNYKEFDNNTALVYEERDGVIGVTPDYQLVNHNKFRNRNDRLGVLDNLFSLNKNYPYQKRLLWVNKVVLIPIRMAITITTNSYDVVHSWFVPGLGLKLDCVPGRSTHHTIYIEYMGYYYGQCAEVCGRRHHHMPIKLRAIPFKFFEYWWRQTLHGSW